jgi:hypothetical protein
MSHVATITLPLEDGDTFAITVSAGRCMSLALYLPCVRSSDLSRLWPTIHATEYF